ncbi:MAG: hypothetical protein Q7J31_08265, partial [Syntrophales bacterium]|nr:hypothetical protein [Syntrophales bacterium]
MLFHFNPAAGISGQPRLPDLPAKIHPKKYFHHTAFLAEQNDRSIAFRLSLPRSGNALFEHAPSQVGIHLPTLGPHNRLSKCDIGDLLSTRKTNKPSGFEDSHETLLKES